MTASERTSIVFIARGFYETVFNGESLFSDVVLVNSYAPSSGGRPGLPLRSVSLPREGGFKCWELYRTDQSTKRYMSRTIRRTGNRRKSMAMR